LEEGLPDKKWWLKLYLFCSLVVLEAAAYAALCLWFWSRARHWEVVSCSVLLAPAWAMLIYKEWQNL
jgi:hypothetical protein